MSDKAIKIEVFLETLYLSDLYFAFFACCFRLTAVLNYMSNVLSNMLDNVLDNTGYSNIVTYHDASFKNKLDCLLDNRLDNLV